MELVKNGYILVRQSKHFVYRNVDGDTIIVPNHNKMNQHTYKSILKQIQKGVS